MDVGEMAGKYHVEDERRHRSAEIAVQRGHRAGFDVAAEARAHDELDATAKFSDEWFQLTKIVRAVAVAHEHVLATDEGEAVDVRSSQAPLRSRQDAGPLRKRDFRRLVGRAVDD